MEKIRKETIKKEKVSPSPLSLNKCYDRTPEASLCAGPLQLLTTGSPEVSLTG